MLESLYLTKSKIRQDILALFFTNPSQKYYLRELQRLLGYSAGNIRRELMKFKNDGLFTTQKTGNLLFYSLNPKHPLFKELKSIVLKTVGVEGALKNTLSSIKKIDLAFIYGSFARGEEHAASDIDLMIIGEPDTSLLNTKIAKLESKLRREINYSVYPPDEYRRKKQSKVGFIINVLKSPKTMLIGQEDDL